MGADFSSGFSDLLVPEWQTPIVVPGLASNLKFGDLAVTNKCRPFRMDGRPGAIEIVWTGNPVGVFTLFGSLLAEPTPADYWALGSGAYNNLSPGAIAAIPDSAGVPGSHLILLKNTPVKWVYLNHARTSGSGTIIVGALRACA